MLKVWLKIYNEISVIEKASEYRMIYSNKF